MNGKQKYLNYIRNGSSSEILVSPQIGGGAGFGTKIVKKEWLEDTTLDDLIYVVDYLGIDPLFNIGLPSIEEELNVESKTKNIEEEKKQVDKYIKTPYGTLHSMFVFQKFHGGTPRKFPVTSGKEFDALEWYIDQYYKYEDKIEEFVEKTVRVINNRGPLSIQWNVQPIELFGMVSTVDMAFFEYDYPKRVDSLREKIFNLDLFLIDKVFESGADMIFLGAPGIEILSEKMFFDIVIPYSKKISYYVHKKGKFVYSHICSPIKRFLEKGFYNEMNMDLFETFSPKPFGDIEDLKSALTYVDPIICTRGNLGLDILLEKKPDKIYEKTLKIIEATKGRKHIVGASDYLFYNIPEENVRAMIKAVHEYNKRLTFNE